MTQEDKEFLIRDLCGRLPYGVKAYIKNWSKLDRKYYEGVYTVESIDSSLNTIVADSERSSVEVIVGDDDYEIKPYLRPMSNMTEEEKLMYEGLMIGTDNNITYILDVIDWLNVHHFDYRDLIEKGLAIDATGLNIYWVMTIKIEDSIDDKVREEKHRRKLKKNFNHDTSN